MIALLSDFNSDLRSYFEGNIFEDLDLSQAVKVWQVSMAMLAPVVTAAFVWFCHYIYMYSFSKQSDIQMRKILQSDFSVCSLKHHEQS